MLGEKVTSEIAKSRNAAGFGENKDAAIDGGEVAGNARKETERKTGRKVVSKENYLSLPEKVKRKQLG